MCHIVTTPPPPCLPLEIQNIGFSRFGLIIIKSWDTTPLPPPKQRQGIWVLSRFGLSIKSWDTTPIPSPPVGFRQFRTEHQKLGHHAYAYPPPPPTPQFIGRCCECKDVNATSNCTPGNIEKIKQAKLIVSRGIILLSCTFIFMDTGFKVSTFGTGWPYRNTILLLKRLIYRKKKRVGYLSPSQWKLLELL